ncbi:MAG: DoxX family protein [Bacteroidetes bacterium]|nr:DoxX family protein [Bacteroidota bacterium]
MRLFFKARGDASFGLLLIRLTLGGIFLVAGASKLLHLEEFIKAVKGMGVLPENIAFIFGFILPFIEVIFGALYIIGFFTPITSFVLSMLLVSFLITLKNDAEIPFTYNWVFLACTLCTMFSGAGLISFDAMLDKKKKTISIQTPPVKSPIVEEKKIQIIEPIEIKEEKIDIH